MMNTIYRLGTAVGATVAILITDNTFSGQTVSQNSNGQHFSMPVPQSTAIAQVP
jgi:hypothetical protein